MKNLPLSPHKGAPHARAKVTPEEAAQELLKRRQARKSLLDFTNFTFSQYVADPAHALIGRKLDSCVDGNIHKLMIFAPPQHGKSELVSVRLPAYWLGHRPDDPVILTSYGASLAHDKSRDARAVVESDEYKRLFGALSPMDMPVDLADGSRAADHWKISEHRGGMLAAGVGGPITGHPAVLGIIDDPFENWEQAQSLTIRNKVWDWYRTVFRPRVAENGVIIIIMTRWHEDDLAGRLLNEQASEWTVLRLPALAETQQERDENNKRLHLAQGEPDPLGREPGEPLCPHRRSKAALLELQRDVGSLGWTSEYQGVPRNTEGNRFKRPWFPIVDSIPTADIKKRVRYWDKAASTNGKRTAGVRMAIATDKTIYIEHVVCGQWTTGVRRAVMKQTADVDGKAVMIYIEQEPGSSGVDSVQDEIKLLQGFTVHADRPSGDKDTRLEPFAAQAEAGNVKLLRGEWNGTYIDEMCAIPNGTYRDQADATAGAFNKLVSSKGFGIA